MNIDWMNDQPYVPEPLVPAHMDDLLKHYASIIETRGDDDRAILRPSTLGKPAVELFAQRFKPEWGANANVVTERLNRLFTAGFLFELEFKRLLYRRGKEYGLSIYDEQIPVDCTDILCAKEKICGTADFILEQNGVRYLVDTKTASDESFRLMTTGTIPREYVVQLSLYAAALKPLHHIDHVGLIVQRKSNSEIAWVGLSKEQLDDGLRHARAVVELWNASATWEEAVKNGLEPPDPVPEIYRKQQTGRYLVPASMRYSNILPHCYELSEELNNYGKMTTYVLTKLFGGK